MKVVVQMRNHSGPCCLGTGQAEVWMSPLSKCLPYSAPTDWYWASATLHESTMVSSTEQERQPDPIQGVIPQTSDQMIGAVLLSGYRHSVTDLLLKRISPASGEGNCRKAKKAWANWSTASQRATLCIAQFNKMPHTHIWKSCVDYVNLCGLQGRSTSCSGAAWLCLLRVFAKRQQNLEEITGKAELLPSFLCLLFIFGYLSSYQLIFPSKWDGGDTWKRGIRGAKQCYFCISLHMCGSDHLQLSLPVGKEHLKCQQVKPECCSLYVASVMCSSA